MSRPTRVAIVGGGCAALAAAFELTRPELAGRFDVTVYQVGWRLGGKGASGRGPSDRIEEHGLHLWMGFYENAFRLMRECYAELARDPACRIATWQDAFVPAPLVGVAEREGTAWQVWKAVLPPMPGLPGDPPFRRRFTLGDYLARSLDLLRALLRTAQPTRDKASARGDAAGGDASSPDDVMARITRFLRMGEVVSLAAVIEAVGLLETVLGSLSTYPRNLVLRFLDAIAANARELVQRRLADDAGFVRIWHVIDLVLATLRGEIRAGVFADPRGFEVLDDYDCREWLLLNGASEESVRSGFVRGLYDLGFSYEDGDTAKPRIAAGQALRGVVRSFFTYRGSFFWKMTAGMGDVVFAPLYEVLSRRGVRFEFFHRLENVRLSPRGDPSPHVAALEFDVQAEIAGGAAYRPLVEVRGLPCWPAAPDWSQLVDGKRLAAEGIRFESHEDRRRVATKTLRVGEDFDFVVLGVGAGAVPFVCRELMERDPRWRAMVDHVKTVATQALQLWLRPDLKELGWSDGSVNISGFVQPFDTWADMSHLAHEESWSEAPGSIAYFCSVLPDEGLVAGGSEEAVEERAAKHVRQNAVRFLERDLRHLWPGVIGPEGRFRWEALAAADPAGPGEEAQGEHRMASQYWRANVTPSDRYTLSLPGSLAHRISPLDRSYDNLTVAGDWTACGFEAGCVEAAVMSGRLAAHALALSPPLEEIVGYDHP